jgi:glycosyltransferase involved in cell wall biosynthesis
MICRQVYPYSIGGAEIHTHSVVKELAKRNKVILISEGKVPLQTQGRFTHLNIKARSIPLLSSIAFILRSLISLLLKVGQIDVLYAQGALSPAVIGVMAKKVLKAPLVITCHGSEVRLQKSIFIRALQRLAYTNNYNNL